MNTLSSATTLKTATAGKNPGVKMLPEGRFRKFSYDEIVARDKTNLDIF
ncbi:hypothetical protein [Methanosarcina siciliae]|nr:hypothetical protein [Methanosarcina siciliae]